MSEVVVQEKTPFEKFIEGYNQDYVMKCKDLGLKNEYELEVNGKPVIFTRKRLTTKQFNDLEQARNKTDKETTDDAMINATRTAELYLTIAQAYLVNKDTQVAITKEEYENTIWEDIKLVLDSCHLRTLIGVPNAVKVSGT